MPGNPNPVEEIGGINTVDDVVKADIVAWAKANLACVLADANDLRARNMSGQLLLALKSNGRTYKLDTGDTTTADDGVNCIHDFNALRFKIQEFASAASTASSGISELTTDAEAITGTDTARVPPASSLLAALKARAQGFAMINGTIVESHGSNATTFAIKTLAGNDPSASDPVTVLFVSATGNYSARVVTAATSVTISSGSTLGIVANGLPFTLNILAIDNAGTVELAVATRVQGVTSTTQSATLAAYINEALLYSSTAEGGAGAADSANVIYSTTARSTKQVRVLARADYDSGLTTAGLWAASPTRITQHAAGMRTSLPVCFFAHKNNTAQLNASHQAYTKVTFSNCRYNVGGYFDTSTSKFMPPPGLYVFGGMAWAQANVKSSPANEVCKLIKNGSIDIAAQEGWAPAGFANTGGSGLPAIQDLANGTDYYELWMYNESSSGTNDVTIDGTPAHTWFCAAQIGN